MSTRISATDAARNLSDVLNRVRYRGDTFVIVRNGEEVGLLSPVAVDRPKTLRQLVRLIDEIGFPDEAFASDLEAVRRDAPAMPEDPWPSS